MQIDAADARTPSAVRNELGRYGGLNPYNRANWRIVLAEDRRELRGGVFTTMPSGDVKAVEFEKVMHNGKPAYRMHHVEVKPEKVETGFIEVPKYPVNGWILERWFPASKKGMSKAAWEDVKSSDGFTPMMGPFPVEGFYFMLAGPFSRIPEMADLKMAISMHIRAEEAQPVSYAQAVLEEMHLDEEEKERAYKKALDDLGHFYESEVEPVMRGSSLGAGRIRNELAESVGDRSHHGVA
jgi:hypothetical protein